MSNDVHSELPKKKSSLAWWIIVLLLLILAFFSFQLFGPNPPIVVSKQTTYITGPLLPDGLPDYEAHVLEAARDGVTPQRNAAVFMWQALGPGDGYDKISAEDWEILCEELDMGASYEEKDYLRPLYGRENRERVREWLNQQFSGEEDSTSAWIEEQAEEAISEALERAWTSSQLPPLAEWIQENQPEIDLLVEGSQKPRSYSPSPSLLNGTNDSLVEMSFGSIQQAREVARILSVRAMWHLGEGRHKEAWNDIMAVYRWARLVGQGGLLIDQLVAVAIDGIADYLAQNILNDPRLSPELVRQIHRDLLSLPSPSQMANSLDKGERLFALDIIVQGATQGFGPILSAGAPNDTSPHGIDYVSVDWNSVLQITNSWYDRLVAAGRSPTHSLRASALKKFEADIQQVYEEQWNPKSLLGGALSRSRRSELVGMMVIGFVMPAMHAATDAEDRAKARMELTRLAAALAVYRAEHGQYPEKLESLVPNVLGKLPVDYHHAKPFIYRRDGDGYLLYSCGANGKHEGGSNEQMSLLEGRDLNELESDEYEAKVKKIPKGADDVSIRLPTPLFQLPKRDEEE